MTTSQPRLLDFAAEQRTFDVGGVKVGGQPGNRPTVLIGSIFYHGHGIESDEDRGVFDSDAATKLIREQEDYAQRTGNPGMLDVVGATPEAIQQHLEFTSGVTDMPLLIDGTTKDVRLAGLEYVARAGIADRAVYNSIQPETDDDELRAIQDAGVTAAIIVTYNLLDFTADGRVACLEQLLPRVAQVGIHKLMIDTCVLDLATMGSACGAMFQIKHRLGLPVGGGIHNAVAVWKGLRTKLGEHASKPCLAAACASAVAIGADFVLYGPVEDAKYLFPATAMVDTAQSQLMMEIGQRPDDGHPRFRVG